VPDVVTWASSVAEARLAVPLERRWRHVRAVAAKAETLRPVLREEADLLVAAAWLHDVGYAPDVVDTAFHPVDGARYLRRLGADERLCGLVAHHSAAAVEAELRGLEDELAEFADEESLVRDALWACDMTTSPVGEPVTFPARLAEIRQRYGEGHTVSRAIGSAAGDITAAIARVTAGASSHGVRLL
jgi:putative nucleotidyltransferase with HDIG domain